MMNIRMTPCPMQGASDIPQQRNPDSVLERSSDVAGVLGSGRRSSMIGEIIRHMNALSDNDLEQILEFQQQKGLLFGEAAVALNKATPTDVAWALSRKFDFAYPRGGSDTCDQELVVARDPFCEQAEAFRHLRSELLSGVMGPHEKRRALAVVSPGRGDGRSFMAANLAVAFSQLGQKTLIVDCDLRKPRLDKLFRIAAHLGLSSMLAGHRDGAMAVPAPGLDHLHVLTVGTLPPNPLELLHRGLIGPLFDDFLKTYDHVIVDTSAGNLGSDGCVAAAHCGAALVVGRQDMSTLQELDDVMTRLDKYAVTITGVLVNRH